jgi:hypothetical protein
MRRKPILMRALRPVTRTVRPTDGNTDLGYNNFWVGMGNNAIEINGEHSTSIIIDPPDGRIPYAEGALPNGIRL